MVLREEDITIHTVKVRGGMNLMIQGNKITLYFEQHQMHMLSQNGITTFSLFLFYSYLFNVELY